MMDCEEIMKSYSRYLLAIFNFVFALTGLVVICVGISVKAYYNEFENLLNEKYFYVSDLLVVIGIIIFFIAFFGCCGAWKENSCMTTTFSALLVVILILELLAGIGGILLKHKTEDFLVDTLKESMTHYNNDSEITDSWDTVQTKLHCCGVLNATDWIAENSTQNQLPITCCEIPHGTTNNFSCNVTKAYHHGCLEVLGDYVRDNTTSIEAVGIGLAVIQLLGIILSCYLAKRIRSDYETV